MDNAVLLIAFVAALLGSALATWTGFGAATILTPVLVLFIDTRQAIFVVAIYHGIHNIVKTVTFRQGIVARIALLFGAGAIVLSPIGGLLSSVVPTSALKILLGLFLILDAVAGLVERNSNQRNALPSNVYALIGGAFSGFAAGIIGTGGAVRALFLHRFLRGKEDYVGTAALIALVIDATRIPVYVALYPVSSMATLLPLTVVIVAAGFIGVFLARGFLHQLSTEKFRKFLLVALIAAGISFVVQGLRA
jgi:uncharacterized membrane protein YfcA